MIRVRSGMISDEAVWTWNHVQLMTNFESDDQAFKKQNKILFHCMNCLAQEVSAQENAFLRQVKHSCSWPTYRKLGTY